MLYIFGDQYTLDPACYELRQHGRLVRLEPRVFDLLAYLVQHPDRTVPKEELLEQLWPQQFVADDSLITCVAQARKALGDTGQTQRSIQTVRRRGYRFIAPVTVRPPAAMAAPSPPSAPPAEGLGQDPAAAVSPPAAGQAAPPSSVPPAPDPARLAHATGPGTPDAERRQLTILVCDLVESTALASQLDPEDYREVVRTYHETSAKVIARFDGYIAQYLGDGLLVYFGYPLAHEDDAQRAVRAGLGMLAALGTLETRLAHEHGLRLAVRLGIHTGVVVVGEVGDGPRQEPLALGETPKIAARLHDITAPNTLVISAATLQLLGGFFRCQPLGIPRLTGLAQPLEVYQVLAESTARSRLEAAMGTDLTPLVDREQEVGLLLERWTQVKEGSGQVVLLCGEAGIGKSRLVQVLKEHVATEPQAWLTPCQCSPYHQNTALYPWIDLLERVALRFDREESPPQKLRKLEGLLVQRGLPLAEAVPLFASLLSIPLGADYAPLNVSPEQQKQQTLHALLTILLRIAAQQPVLFVMEDLQWVDPTTVELLSLLVDQGPTARILALLTFRPDFSPPWRGRSHLTQVTLQRLTPRQAVELTGRVAHGKALPAAVMEQVVTKTDGVPLFVEELTKTVLESGVLREGEDHYELRGPLPPLAIPTTLQDSLMARLDRLGSVKRVAQLGATIGRQFAYDLLQAVCPLDAATVQASLRQLVEVELCYQRGVPPHATYLFKHALIQEVAYQSLLKRTRQHYHQRIAQVLEAQFPEMAARQPELLAQHYTAAGCSAQAVVYWQRAGQRALERSAHREATVCFEQALGAVQHLPEEQATREQAIELRFSLRNALLPLGAHGRICDHLRAAQTLAEALNDQRRLGRACAYLAEYFRLTGDLDRAVESGERALALATAHRDVALEVMATFFVGLAYHALGDYRRAVDCFSRNVASLTRDLIRERFGMTGFPSVMARTWLVSCLAELGEFAEGATRGEEAVRIAESLEHPFSLTQAHFGLGHLYLRKGDLHRALPVLERGFRLCQVANIPTWFPTVAAALGYAYTLAGQVAEALPLLKQVVEQKASMGISAGHARHVAYLSEAYLLAGRIDQATDLAGSALAFARDLQERGYEAYALWLLGEIHAHQEPPELETAEAFYQQAFALAEALGMRPLLARGHLGLGTLYAKRGQLAQARIELSTAIALFRAMAMTFWLPQAEVVLAQVNDSGLTERGEG